jgi:hypothetical protein
MAGYRFSVLTIVCFRLFIPAESYPVRDISVKKIEWQGHYPLEAEARIGYTAGRFL